MIHALDAANNSLSDRMCDNTGVLYDEVRAVIAENGYRARYGLPPRTTYDGKPIPSTLAGCTPPTIPPSRPGNRTRYCDTSRCGQTSGDPHLITVDGYRYDFQAVGEFTAATSSTGDFNVQVRQTAYPQSRTVAVNRAVAIRVETTRLGFYLVNGTIVVHREGSPVALPAGTTTLPGGASITRNNDPYSGDDYDTVWPDDSFVSVWRNGSEGLLAIVAPAPTRAGTLSGLLGNFDGDSTNDIALKAGPVLPQPVSFGAVYPALADSWRVSDADSLFDYAAGQDTAAFTDRGFPAGPATVADLPPGPRAAAQTACEAAGATDPADFDACVLDVALTGQGEFAFSAADRQHLSSPTGGTPTGSTPSGQTTVATITDPGGTTRITYQGIRGRRLFVQVVSTTLPPKCGALTLLAPDGTTLARGCLDATGGFIDGTLLPSDGDYTLVIGPDGTASGTATVRFVATVDQSVSAAIDGPPATVTIAAPGGFSRVAFTGNANQKIFVTVSEATLPAECTALALVDPGGLTIAGGCFDAAGGFIDGTVLPTTGEYAIVVNPNGVSTGQLTLHLGSATDQQVSTRIDGPPVNLSVAQPGAVARATFTATAGQKVAVAVTGATLPADCSTLALIDPGGLTIAGGRFDANGTGHINATVLPANGTYAIVVNPSAASTGQLTVQITAAP